MKQIALISIIFLAWSFPSLAQELTCSRRAELQDGNYTISGNAYLELFDDGNLKLRLDKDFETPAGPDVQVFLADDSVSVNGGVMIKDIGTTDGINHFSGEITFDVPAGTDIDRYNYVVFRCVAFSITWAHGRLGTKNCDSVMQATCIPTFTGSNDSTSTISICPSDGEEDIVPFWNNKNLPAGANYAYIVTDTFGNLQNVLLDNSYDFEGSSDQMQRVYGVSYMGQLNYTLGNHLSTMSATECIELSSQDTFLTIKKEGCIDTFACQSTIVATTNWVVELHICPSDGIDNQVPLLNNLMLPVGEHYAFIITDTLGRIQQVHHTGEYNFEGSGPEPQHVYGVSYDQDLQYAVGNHFSTISATGCLVLSDTMLFLKVFKDSCETSSVAGIRISQFDVQQNTPNPVISITQIGYYLSEPGQVYLDLYDAMGRKLLSNQYGWKSSGAHEIKLDKSAISQQGVIYYQLHSGRFSITRKMVIW